MVEKINNARDWLLIANGEPVSPQLLKELAIGKNILVLDGAYSYVVQSGLTIDVLLGDFDSIAAVDLAKARQSKTKVIHAPDQNKTDLEKGLEFIDSTQPNSIIICAAIGKRLQHALYNLRILKKYHSVQRPLTLFSDQEVIRYCEDTNVLINGKIKDSLGILGFSHGVISTTGLKWDVTDYLLEFEKGNSVLNELAQTEATIRIKGSALIIHEVRHCEGTK